MLQQVIGDGELPSEQRRPVVVRMDPIGEEAVRPGGERLEAPACPLLRGDEAAPLQGLEEVHRPAG